jgi:hypothetical protein
MLPEPNPPNNPRAILSLDPSPPTPNPRHYHAPTFRLARGPAQVAQSTRRLKPVYAWQRSTKARRELATLPITFETEATLRHDRAVDR